VEVLALGQSMKTLVVMEDQVGLVAVVVLEVVILVIQGGEVAKV